MRFEGRDRYQFQPRHVKAWRWLRHMPVAWVRACWRTTCWAATGAKPDVMPQDLLDLGVPPRTRRQTLRTIWMFERSGAAMRMGRYSTAAECFQEVRRRRAAAGDKP